MIYEARTNFADEKPLYVYTEEQLKNSYNRVQRDSIKRVLGQEKSRYGFYWKLGDEKTTESGNPIKILTRDDIPYTREDMVYNIDEPTRHLILALKPEIEQKDWGNVIKGEVLRRFVTEEGIEDLKRCHCIEGYHVYDTYEEARAKDAAKAPPNYYRLSYELYMVLMSYDIDSEGNAYSFKKYWQRCNLDKKENIS